MSSTMDRYCSKIGGLSHVEAAYLCRDCTKLHMSATPSMASITLKTICTSYCQTGRRGDQSSRQGSGAGQMCHCQRIWHCERWSISGVVCGKCQQWQQQQKSSRNRVCSVAFDTVLIAVHTPRALMHDATPLEPCSSPSPPRTLRDAAAWHSVHERDKHEPAPNAALPRAEGMLSDELNLDPPASCHGIANNTVQA